MKPEEGMEVIATGKITTYPGKSTYQIVVEHIEPAGKVKGPAPGQPRNEKGAQRRALLTVSHGITFAFL